MYSIAMDTSTEYCSVSLLKDGLLLKELSDNSQRSHNKFLFNFLESLLDQYKLNIKDISSIFVGKGPGSFTGLRVGMSTAKALSYALNIKYVPVSSIDAMALAIYYETKKSIPFRVIFDGRQKDCFSALYQYREQKIVKISDIEIFSYNDIPDDCEFMGGDVDNSLIDRESYKSGFFPKSHCLAKVALMHNLTPTFDINLEPDYYKKFKINKGRNKVLM